MAIQSAEQSLVEVRDLLGPKGREPANGIFAFIRNGSDSPEMDVDGGTPVAFSWTNEVAAGRIAYLTRTLITALGGATEDHDGFFSLAALTNGLLIDIRDENGTVVQAFETDSLPIKRHVEFGNLAGVDIDTDSGAGVSRYNIRWTFSKATGRPLLLRPGWSFRVTVRDALQTLTMFRISVQGYR